MEKQVYGIKQFRFNVKKGASVVLAPGKEVWQIENISLKGLSFWYIPGGEPLEDPTQIDIFVNNKTLYLKCVPCKIVSDSSVKMDSGNGFPWRKQTVEFGKMKPAQQTVLKSFLEMSATK